MNTSPHRAEPLSAVVTVTIDGVPHSAEVVLTPTTQPPKSTALRVVRNAGQEHAICSWCVHGATVSTWWCVHGATVSTWCYVRHGYQSDCNRDGSCTLYAPTLWTRLLRALRLGRKATPLCP